VSYSNLIGLVKSRWDVLAGNTGKEGSSEG
jgi:hypothetical protein